MVSNKAKAVYLIVLILFLGVVLLFVADWTGSINLAKKFPILAVKEKKLSIINEPEDLLEKEELKKQKEKLIEREENLAKKEIEIKMREEILQKLQDELSELQSSLEVEKKKIAVLKQEALEYKARVVDMAGKIANMPPDASVKIMLTWPDPDIIGVLRQIDIAALEAGQQSMVPYLMTLIDKQSPGRAGIISHKMLEDPKLGIADASP